MHDLGLLADLLILVAFAIPAVALAERVKVPSIVGFLIAGMAIGPYGLGLIDEASEVQSLAELGVVLLLFEIGIEISLARIINLRSVVLVGGALQVGVTIAVVSGIGIFAGTPWGQAVAFGCLLALSSTAVVLKAYRDRGELDTPYGRVALAILLFQDLAIVPLVVLMPLLAGGPEANLVSALSRVGLSVVVLASVVIAGRLLVPWILEHVARLRTRDLFTLSIAFVGLGAAVVTASVGLSLALGAFVAGLIISESEYGAQALSDVLPFRALFSGVFFTSVGMLLDLSFVLDHVGLVAGVSIGLILGKTAIVAVVVLFALRRSLLTSLMTGLGLAQVGEFSFVLAGVATTYGLVTGTAYQVFLAATVLSMLAAPLLITQARTVGEWLAGSAGRTTGTIKAYAKAHAREQVDHAIIVGYGMSGRNLARVLKAVHLPYLVLEVNGQLVRQARQEREPIFFGDGTRREVLEHAGVRDARSVIFNISSPIDEQRGVMVARELNPKAQIVVRTRTVDAIPDLERRGATDVVVEEYEAALEVFQRVLRYYRIPFNTIAAELDAVRSEHYGILRGVPKETLHLDSLKYLGIHHALEIVEVEEGSPAVGENPTTLELRGRTGATVVAVVCDGIAHYAPDDFRFKPGDVVVLVGPSPAIEKGMRLFRDTAAGDGGT